MTDDRVHGAAHSPLTESAVAPLPHLRGGAGGGGCHKRRRLWRPPPRPSPASGEGALRPVRNPGTIYAAGAVMTRIVRHYPVEQVHDHSCERKTGCSKWCRAHSFSALLSYSHRMTPTKKQHLHLCAANLEAAAFQNRRLWGRHSPNGALGNAGCEHLGRLSYTI